MVANHLKRLLSAALIVACAGPADAQPALQAKPATPDELLAYSVMGGISICNSVKNGFTDYDKAMANAIVMTSFTIVNLHNSEVIESSGKAVKLNLRQIESGVLIQALDQVNHICANELKDASKKQFEAQKKIIEEALKKPEAPTSK